MLLIGETRAFWLKVPYVAPSGVNGPQLDAIFTADAEPAAWTQRLSHLGFTHLLVSNSEIERWHTQYGYLSLPPGQGEKLSAWMHTLQKLFDDGRGAVLLDLRRAAH